MYFIEISLISAMAYLIGSFSSAIIVCKLMGLPDPRTQGSQNPGATNVLRIGGKKAAALTLFGDMLKGVLPVFAVKLLGGDAICLASAAFFAFIGHLWPLFFHFHGGKGVATFLGCLLALSWPTSFCWIGIWLFMAIFFRYSSLAALSATLISPLILYYDTKTLIYAVTFSVMAILLIYRHRSNIIKLITGKEHKIGKP